MTGRAYEVVVVGAGLDGLVAAITLARDGKDVLVVERRENVGGLAAGEEFHPGYRTAGVLHDTSGVRRAVARRLDLERHGLRFTGAASVYAPEELGPGLLLDGEWAAAALAIRERSPADAERYLELEAWLDAARPVVRDLVDRPPPATLRPGLGETLSIGRVLLALRGLGADRMAELLRMAPMPVADWLGERFEDDLVAALLAGPALDAVPAGPRSPGTAANLLLHDCLADGRVVGGPAALARTLQTAAVASGVPIRTGRAVERVLVEGGKVRGVRLADGEEVPARIVLATCDPRTALLDLVGGRWLDRRAERRIRAFRGTGSVAVVRLAVDGPLAFTGRPDEIVGFARTGECLDDLERAYDPWKYGELPRRPVLDVRVPTVDDPDLAPPGHHVVTVLARFVPYRLDGGWTHEARGELGERVVAELDRYAPGLRRGIVGREVLTPADLERRYALPEGHLHHGDHALDQLVVRPTPECVRYRTPIEGLWLGGGGSHPGGGVTLAPGALAAAEILGG